MKTLLKKIFAWFLDRGYQTLNLIALILIYIFNKGNLGVEVTAGLMIFILITIAGYKTFIYTKSVKNTKLN